MFRFEDAGSYSLLVSNVSGPATSTVAILSVEVPLFISRLSPTRLDLSWPLAFTNHALKSRTDLPGSGWTAVPEPEGTGPTAYHVYVTNTGPRRFFRLGRP